MPAVSLVDLCGQAERTMRRGHAIGGADKGGGTINADTRMVPPTLYNVLPNIAEGVVWCLCGAAC